MGKQEFARMLEGIVNDGETAGRVAGGDFSDMASGELSEAEQALLTAAAGDLDDEVSGFGSSYLKLGDIEGESKSFLNLDGSGLDLSTQSVNVRSAFSYLKLGDIKG